MNKFGNDPGSPSSRTGPAVVWFAGLAEHDASGKDGRLAPVVVGDLLLGGVDEDVGNARSRTTGTVCLGVLLRNRSLFGRGQVE